ncbi:cytochrome P450 [Thelephora ganbajun]|uniref:Cytochrome P450 n=1 Tax=Thelephora ganbajun TaxID=370292 RepID=A0ACB6YZK7_THEGA|nr:cytochrome P450 [Thelephora ganbajun]
MVPHLIPWMGSALEIGRNPDTFFNRAQRKYGDVFAVKAFGRDIAFVVSPSLTSEVHRKAQKYDFGYYRVTLTTECFAVPARPVLKRIHSIDTLDVLTVFCFSLMKSDPLSKVLRPAHHRHLSPTGIGPTIEFYTTAVWDLLEKEGSRFAGVSTPLRDLVLPVLYQSSAYAFFGRSCPVLESYQAFNDIDTDFHLLFAGVPRIFLRKSTEGVATMNRLFEKYFDGPHEEASEYVLESERMIRDQGYDSKAVGAYLVCFFFALMTNAPNAGYWMIILNLKREEGLQPLVNEIDEAVASWKHQNPGQGIEDHLYGFVSTVELPLLTSTIQETLRYVTSSVSIRRVTEPVELGGYRFDEGDEVACMTRSVHLDEEIHKEVSEYNPRRFRCVQEARALTSFMVSLLVRYTLEIDSKCSERPMFMLERVGTSALQPRGDIRIILHARK